MSILGKPITFGKNHDGKSALSIAKYFVININLRDEVSLYSRIKLTRSY